jgi:hypothetical protein
LLGTATTSFGAPPAGASVETADEASVDAAALLSETPLAVDVPPGADVGPALLLLLQAANALMSSRTASAMDSVRFVLFILSSF